MLEVRSTGYYKDVDYDFYVNGDEVQPPSSSLFHFGDIYSPSTTSMSDLGQIFFSRRSTDQDIMYIDQFVLEQGSQAIMVELGIRERRGLALKFPSAQSQNLTPLIICVTIENTELALYCLANLTLGNYKHIFYCCSGS